MTVRMIRVLCLLAVLALLFAFGRSAPAKDDWPPISPADLTLKDNPAKPGSAAMILEKDDFLDQSNAEDFSEVIYCRIKIFTEQGKKYADIEVPYDKAYAHVKDVKARTIHPDGKIIEFDGTTFDKTIVKSRFVKVFAKTFTLPDVEPGSIIEYKYKITFGDILILNDRWPLQQDLYARQLVYSVRPWPRMTLHWTGRTLNGEQLQNDHGVARLVTSNVPAFEVEDFMPPEEEMKPHVDFYYSNAGAETPDQFWQRTGKERTETYENFIGRRNYVAQVADQTVAANDPPDIKLKKLYARVQQIRNLSFERLKSEKEQKRENIKDNHNVEDVLKHGYGDGIQIDEVFVALARAAGFDSAIVNVARRNRVFFSREILSSGQLNDVVAWVKLGAEDVYLDPGTRMCPYGLLPWAETETTGLKLDRKNPTFINTPTSKPADAVTERKAQFTLEPDGALSGKLQISFGGLQALRRRLEEIEEDDAGRQKDIHDEIAELFPAGSKVELTSIQGWDDTAGPLRAEATLRIPGFAMPAGRRILLPVTIFQSGIPHSFQHATRQYPVYFAYPFQDIDDVTISLPAGFRVETLPPPAKMPAGAAEYNFTIQQEGNTLHMQRTLIVRGVYFPVQYYSALRSFFNNVKTDDEQQAILQPAQSGSD